MTEKRPVDHKRERSGHFDVGNEQDGAIEQTLNVDGKLLVIKERAIYEVTFADTLDPERQHPDLPTVIQKVLLPLGTESEIVSRTYLMALMMFKKEYIAPYVDLKKALATVLELLVELNALNEEKESYLNAERAAIKDYNERKELKVDYKLPSIPDLQTRLKTFFQKADHVLQSLMEINSLFFTEHKLNLRAHWDTFQKLLKDTYGDKDGFIEFMDSVLPFLRLTRGFRDCFDHRLENVQVKDFSLQMNNDVLTPTIAMNHRKEKLDEMPVAELLEVTTDNLLYIVEQSIAHLCSKHPKPGAIMAYQVREIPLYKRRNKLIRYAFWAPLGPEGFFMQ